MFKMRYTLQVILIFALAINMSVSIGTEKDPKHTNIILVGATGDLAQRYLWKGLFNLFKEHFQKGKRHFSIYGCGRTRPEEGRSKMSEILLHVLTCHEEKCRDLKKEFVEVTQYHQLKTEKHYKLLADKIAENTLSIYGLNQGDGSLTFEDGRIIYLSIPPSSYAKTSELVNSHLRPRLGRAWVRLVIEKPFGFDRDSAEKLSEILRQNFAEEEIYRVDHYLGKPVVQQIIPFRYINRDLYEPMWNYHHVERVEIVMKEVVDAKGRMSFYDEVGVVRDVVQNHLTEMMMLVAMDLPKNSGNITEMLRNKVAVLKQVEPLQPQSTLIGQYASYIEEAMEEFKKKEYSSNTPTFSVTLMHVNNARWRNVPFLLLSGKKMDEKSSYVRIVFKKNHFCMEKDGKDCDDPKQIIFLIGSGNLNKPPMIAISRSLLKPLSAQSWEFENIRTNFSVFGENLSNMYQLLPTNLDDTYTSLISAVYSAQRHLFTNTDCLLASWDIWSPHLKHIADQTPRLYRGGDIDPKWLNFRYSENSLEFLHEAVEFSEDTIKGDPAMSHVPGTYRDQQLVSGPTADVISHLATDIEVVAHQAVAEKGSFHFGISGGNSPKRLLQYMVKNLLTFPWQQTHIWFVDERCVALDNEASNFNMLNTYLLRNVNIPYLNIHPMPVQVQGDICDEEDNADNIYEVSIHRLVPGTQIDFVLLGVGSDGHTASLFPGQPSLEIDNKLVTYASGGPSNVSSKRITMTLTIINKARNIGVLLMGKDKHGIIHTLGDGQVNITQYPITGVKPETKSLVWYIDFEALLGS